MPTTLGAFQATIPTNPPGGPQAAQSAFVARFDPSGTRLIYGSYLASTDATTNNEQGQNIVADQFGTAYITGFTNGTDFPTTRNAFQGSGTIQNNRVGGRDAFLSVLNTNQQQLPPANGNGLLYSTYLGGTGTDQGNSVTVHLTTEQGTNGL